MSIPFKPGLERMAVQFVNLRRSIKNAALARLEDIACRLSSEKAGRRSLMLGFESLGDNCEFGLVQRHWGAEPLGLLRFSAITPAGLIEAIDSRFGGLLSPDEVKLSLDRAYRFREYQGIHERYEMRFHTHVWEGEVAPDEAPAFVQQKLRFLVRKLLEDIEEGEKIFVYKTSIADDSYSERLARALRRWGPARLLYVTPAAPGHPPGTVVLNGDALFRGYLDHVSHGDVRREEIRMEAWLDLCRKTEALRQAESVTERMAPAPATLEERAPQQAGFAS